MAVAMVGLIEPEPLPLWIAAAASLCVLGSLVFDAYGGVIVALVCASALVAVRRLTGHWSSDDFPLALAETGLLLLLGALSGATGRSLRTGAGSAEQVWSSVEPVYGSLGLLGSDAASARLEEEVERARLHRRELSVVIFDSHLRHTDLSEQGRAAAMRAVARIVESRADEIEVPFALAASRVGWILPEVSTVRAWESVGLALEAIAGARFTFGIDRAQRSLGEAVDVQVGITTLGPARQTSQELLDAAIAAAHVQADDAEQPR